MDNEINSLTALLDRSHGTLHGILTEFNSMFKGALAIFSATSILANYLNNNVHHSLCRFLQRNQK